MALEHFGQHEEDCFACALKCKGVAVAPSAVPSRMNWVPPRQSDNNRWENGVVTDNRGMPYLDQNLQPVTQKEWAEGARRQHEEGARRRAAKALAST